MCACVKDLGVHRVRIRIAINLKSKGKIICVLLGPFCSASIAHAPQVFFPSLLSQAGFVLIGYCSLLEIRRLTIPRESGLLRAPTRPIGN